MKPIECVTSAMKVACTVNLEPRNAPNATQESSSLVTHASINAHTTALLTQLAEFVPCAYLPVTLVRVISTNVHPVAALKIASTFGKVSAAPNVPEVSPFIIGMMGFAPHVTETVRRVNLSHRYALLAKGNKSLMK